MGCLRRSVFIFNFIIFFCGAIILGLGIWTAIGNSGLQALMSDVMYIGVYIIIASGALIMMVSLLGCYACASESKPGIVTYCVIVLIVIVLEVAGCIVLYLFYVSSTDLLKTTYLQEYSFTNQSTLAWDGAQREGKCCGFVKYWDWRATRYYNETGGYPASCCVLDSDSQQPINLEECKLGRQNTIHEKGCKFLLEVYYYALGCTTILSVICELCAILFIVCTYQKIP